MLSRRMAIAINVNGQIWPGYAMDTAKNYSSVWKRSSLEKQIVCQVAGFHGISYHIDGKLKLSGEQRPYNGDEYKYRILY
jgi:hypothetical protein